MSTSHFQKPPILIFLFLSSIFVSCQEDIEGDLCFVEKDPEQGFNFPYFLYVPETIAGGKELYLIVEPNNSGFANDNFEEHIEKAERIASFEFYPGNYVARKLQLPLLVPVFPRSKTTGNIYTHSLDRDVVLQKDNDLERIDLQLLAMVENAEVKLQEKGISIKERFLMTGFSASGTFANRFSLIHPEKVKAVAAGGLNGILMLPFSEENGQSLTFPAGTKDFEKLFNKRFQLENFKEIPQFLFMGELDDNDALPYDDAYDEEERQAIYAVLGREMLPTRWNNSRNRYLNSGVKADIRTYREIGHEAPEQVKEDIVKFFSKAVKQ